MERMQFTHARINSSRFSLTIHVNLFQTSQSYPFLVNYYFFDVFSTLIGSLLF